MEILPVEILLIYGSGIFNRNIFFKKTLKNQFWPKTDTAKRKNFHPNGKKLQNNWERC